ncbi:hypothetical protein Tco_0647548 [Tanacetum coccineum]
MLTYGGSPVAYASQPVETFNNVFAHDNETLFDIIRLETQMELSVNERCRMNHLATGIIALTQVEGRCNTLKSEHAAECLNIRERYIIGSIAQDLRTTTKRVV